MKHQEQICGFFSGTGTVTVTAQFRLTLLRPVLPLNARRFIAHTPSEHYTTMNQTCHRLSGYLPYAQMLANVNVNIHASFRCKRYSLHLCRSSAAPDARRCHASRSVFFLPKLKRFHPVLAFLRPSTLDLRRPVAVFLPFSPLLVPSVSSN